MLAPAFVISCCKQAATTQHTSPAQPALHQHMGTWRGTFSAICLPLCPSCRYVNVYGGRAPTEDEITGLLIAALFAGQHTSSITASWTGYFMINDKVGLGRSRGCDAACL